MNKVLAPGLLSTSRLRLATNWALTSLSANRVLNNCARAPVVVPSGPMLSKISLSEIGTRITISLSLDTQKVSLLEVDGLVERLAPAGVRDLDPGAGVPGRDPVPWVGDSDRPAECTLMRCFLTPFESVTSPAVSSPLPLPASPMAFRFFPC